MKNSKPRSRARRRGKEDAGRSQRGTSAGSKILAAIEEATDLLRAEGLESEQLMVRTYPVPPPPRAYQPADVKRVRELLGASQMVLAGFLGVNVNTVRSWEQGKRPPQRIACRFLAEIEADPGYWRGRIAPEAIENQPGKRDHQA